MGDVVRIDYWDLDAIELRHPLESPPLSSPSASEVVARCDAADAAPPDPWIEISESRKRYTSDAWWFERTSVMPVGARRLVIQRTIMRMDGDESCAYVPAVPQRSSMTSLVFDDDAERDEAIEEMRGGTRPRPRTRKAS